MNHYSGTCVGGPWDGMLLDHWAKRKKLFRPMMGRASFLDNSDAPVEAVEIGEYRINDFQQWHWWATEEGRAFDKLFGPA